MWFFPKLKLLQFDDGLLQKQNGNPFTEFIFLENENYSLVKRWGERDVDSLRTITDKDIAPCIQANRHCRGIEHTDISELCSGLKPIFK
jgi:hypothetical protein